MPVIKTIKNEDCTIYIHNDRMVKTKEERKQIIDRVSQIIMQYYRNKGGAA